MTKSGQLKEGSHAAADETSRDVWRRVMARIKGNGRAAASTPLIDTRFDFRSDTPPGKDPDAKSPTLRRYHKLLWSKPLPRGQVFELLDTTPRVYLHHRSELGEYWLSSDTVVPMFAKADQISDVLDRIPLKDWRSFARIRYTIGGMMVFPANKIDGKVTINGARGFHPLIKDRFDLTVECIRRHYIGETSPLSDTLARYADFFRLFADFRGYVEFFLLQDLVTSDCSAVRFFLPFSGFGPSPLPQSVSEYVDYRQRAMSFIGARNRRISDYCATLARPSDCAVLA